MTKRLIGYARVSTDDQSTDAQVDALRSAGCERVFTDHGVSGATITRPNLNACLAALAEGDVLVVVRLDRLGRTMGHLVTTVEGLAERGVGFRSLSESIDTTTATGRLVLNIFAALAAFERDLVRERTTAALQAKKRRGEKLGRPFALTPSQVKAAKKMIDCGESASHVARVLRVDRSTIYRALSKIAA